MERRRLWSVEGKGPSTLKVTWAFQYNASIQSKMGKPIRYMRLLRKKRPLKYYGSTKKPYEEKEKTHAFLSNARNEKARVASLGTMSEVI